MAFSSPQNACIPTLPRGPMRSRLCGESMEKGPSSSPSWPCWVAQDTASGLGSSPDPRLSLALLLRGLTGL